MQRRAGQKARVAMVVCSVIAGFGITAGILSVVHGRFFIGDTTANGATRTGHASVIREHGDGLSPADLDAQWLSYSDHSGCADWAGGDGVSAIRLNSSQIAWFFADTYLGPASPTTGFSHLSGFVHNSVVVQTTSGDRTRLVTLTGGGGCASTLAGPAVSVVSAPKNAAGRVRYWDADGIRVGAKLVKFYNAYLYGRAPYVPKGTTIASFSVGKLSAAGRSKAGAGVTKPRLTAVPTYTPNAGGTPIVWGTALLKSGSTVYIYGWQSPSMSSSQRLLYLARVSAARLADVAAWRFYAGGGQWSASQSRAVPVEPSTGGLNVASAFSVVHIAGRYWLIQNLGEGDPDIYAYPATTPWGPFDANEGILLFHAHDIGLDAGNDYRVMYEARAEPSLSTSKTLVISYNVTSEAVTAACMSISRFTNAFLQPRFVAVPKSAFTASSATAQDLARAGGPAYPKVVQRHPGEWFDALSFPSGCPPVPGVTRVTAQTGAGAVRLNWPSAGIGMRYRVYLSSGQGYQDKRTVSSPGVTLTGLSSGVTYDFEVVPVSTHSVTGPPGYVSVTLP